MTEYDVAGAGRLGSTVIVALVAAVMAVLAYPLGSLGLQAVLDAVVGLVIVMAGYGKR